MSHVGTVDPLPHLEAAARALAAGGPPAAAFAAIDRAMDAAIGHKLFTVLRFHADSGESETWSGDVIRSDETSSRLRIASMPTETT